MWQVLVVMGSGHEIYIPFLWVSIFFFLLSNDSGGNSLVVLY